MTPVQSISIKRSTRDCKAEEGGRWWLHIALPPNDTLLMQDQNSLAPRPVEACILDNRPATLSSFYASMKVFLEVEIGDPNLYCALSFKFKLSQHFYQKVGPSMCSAETMLHLHLTNLRKTFGAGLFKSQIQNTVCIYLFLCMLCGIL